MKDLLLLTPSERRLFIQLDPNLIRRWQGSVQDAPSIREESPDVLDRRFRSIPFDDTPAGKRFVERVRGMQSRGEDIQCLKLTDVPTELLAPILYALGTRVVSAIIVDLLHNAPGEEEVRAVASLSAFRAAMGAHLTA